MRVGSMDEQHTSTPWGVRELRTGRWERGEVGADELLLPFGELVRLSLQHRSSSNPVTGSSQAVYCSGLAPFSSGRIESQESMVPKSEEKYMVTT